MKCSSVLKPYLVLVPVALLVAAACGDDKPELADDTARTARGITVVIDVLANDSGADAIASLASAAHGTAAIVDGRVSYTPSPEFAGTEDLRYTVAGAETEGRIAIEVLAQPGTVAHETLYLAESSSEISWDGINAAGDRVGQYATGPNAGKLVVVKNDGTRQIIEPPEPAEYVLVRAIADDGTVLAQYLSDARGQFIGFAWKDGVYGRVCDPGEGMGDCTLDGITADGTIVGFTYDYTLYTAFVWPAGGERTPLALAGYASTYAYDVSPSGRVVGVGDNSPDGYSGPQRCFSGAPGSVVAQPFSDGSPHFVFCYGINHAGWIAGSVKPLADSEGVPRSQSDRARGALWSPDGVLDYVAFPFERPSTATWRTEFLNGINEAGVLTGYYQDVDEENGYVTYGITLTPVEALPNTSYRAVTFDHVNGAL